MTEEKTRENKDGNVFLTSGGWEITYGALLILNRIKDSFPQLDNTPKSIFWIGNIIISTFILWILIPAIGARVDLIPSKRRSTELFRIIKKNEFFIIMGAGASIFLALFFPKSHIIIYSILMLIVFFTFLLAYELYTPRWYFSGIVFAIYFGLDLIFPDPFDGKFSHFVDIFILLSGLIAYLGILHKYPLPEKGKQPQN